MTALLVSHNKLTESVPAAIQISYLILIDMSYNWFNGKVRNNFFASYADEELPLQVDALSGDAPSSHKDSLHVKASLRSKSTTFLSSFSCLLGWDCY
ncbi:hypothetical protein EON65_27720 [archaeon]|nr:MAG: hypothetical protein EON65_27720 [archaeon]